jgi:hypothetical protein
MNVLIIIIAYDVGGSNPAPATNIFTLLQLVSRLRFDAAFCILNYCRVHCHVSFMLNVSS